VSSRVLVLAGSYKQARAYAHFTGLEPSDWLYPFTPEDIAKFEICEIVMTGTHDQRPGAVEFLQAAAEAMARSDA
jgi:hypothetical protein